MVNACMSVCTCRLIPLYCAKESLLCTWTTAISFHSISWILQSSHHCFVCLHAHWMWGLICLFLPCFSTLWPLAHAAVKCLHLFCGLCLLPCNTAAHALQLNWYWIQFCKDNINIYVCSWLTVHSLAARVFICCKTVLLTEDLCGHNILPLFIAAMWMLSINQVHMYTEHELLWHHLYRSTCYVSV